MRNEIISLFVDGVRQLPLIVFPTYQLLVIEERLREQEEAGIKMPEGMERDELALRILIAVAMCDQRERPPPGGLHTT